MGSKEVTLILKLANARHGPEANLGEGWTTDRPHDHLVDPASAVAYLEFEGIEHPAGVPSELELGQLRTLADGVSMIHAGPAPVARDGLDDALRPYRYRLTPDGDLVADAEGWVAFAAQAARGLAELSAFRDRLRRCANPQCSWLFLDDSRNHSRQWCSMDSCGSRAKMARYRSRKRRGGPAEASETVAR